MPYEVHETRRESLLSTTHPSQIFNAISDLIRTRLEIDCGEQYLPHFGLPIIKTISTAKEDGRADQSFLHLDITVQAQARNLADAHLRLTIVAKTE